MCGTTCGFAVTSRAPTADRPAAYYLGASASGPPRPPPPPTPPRPPPRRRAAARPPDAALEGRPLQDLLPGAPGGAAARPPIPSVSRTALALRDPGGYRLVVPTAEGEALGLPVQLYKLSEDPHERRNLAALPLAETTEADGKMLQQLRAAHDAALSGFTLFEGQSLVCDDPAQAQVIAELEASRP